MNNIHEDLYKELLRQNINITRYLEACGIDKGHFYKLQRGEVGSSKLSNLRMLVVLSTLKNRAIDAAQLVDFLWEDSPLVVKQFIKRDK
jgi:hypothetical protein|tara:strand:+ start:635 stop:901 length:267 start_codon:yes stop_codon:yes gene_type:complete